MARKQGVAGATKAELEEWDKVLRQHKLPEGRGRRNWLSYVGGANDIDYVGGAVRCEDGKVTTSNESDD
jgi:hypothetical protein